MKRGGPTDMNLRAWFTAFRDAFLSMTQSSLMSLASMATVAVSLLVLSVVLLLAVNMEHWATTVEQQIEVKVYLCAAFDDSARCNKTEPTEDQKRVILEYAKMLPGVKEATYLTKEQALERFRTDFGEQKEILEGLEGDNPLSDMIELKVVDPSDARTVAAAMDAEPGVRKVDFGQEWVERLVAFTKAVRIGGMGLVVLLVIATVLTISNTIRLAVYARRREIAIMKLVGATDWYIRRPFMIEGVFLGIIGAVLATVVTGYGYQRIVASAYASVPFLPIVPPEDVLMSMSLSLALLGAVLGGIGSLISMRRFLKV